MADVLLFHHIQGLTPGVTSFADALRAAGHDVHTPDLYGGRTFDTIVEGAQFAQGDGAPDLPALADAATEGLSDRLVYAGISSGVVHAQRLAQRRPGARGAVLIDACLPVSGEWGFGPWPEGVPVQVHGKDDDEFFAHEGDVDAARELVGGAADGELHLYPGDEHLWLDRSLPSHDPAATVLLTERVLQFLGRV